jgi:hypothetical protein
MVMNFAFPFGFDHNGRTATDDSTAHVRSMIEQILFTNPGERVNRPDFGSGLLGLVHSPNSEVMAAALQASVHGALQRWLGDVLDVHNKLLVNVVYALRRTGELMNESFERSVA